MAASKPTSSLSKQRHILSTESHLGALAGGLGCCPLDYEAYPPQSECRGTGSLGIRSLIGFGSLVGPLSHSVLYHSSGTVPTLALKRFRREPAITGFD
jgi:hypothetical protein